LIEQIKEELSEKERVKKEMANTRYMNTTTKTEFGPKHVAESGNIVGRRVMKDQSGQPVAPHNRDEELLVTQGFLERP